MASRIRLFTETYILGSCNQSGFQLRAEFTALPKYSDMFLMHDSN